MFPRDSLNGIIITMTDYIHTRKLTPERLSHLHGPTAKKYPAWVGHSNWLAPQAYISNHSALFLSPRVAAPSLFGSRDQFRRRQFFHRLGGGGMVSG